MAVGLVGCGSDPGGAPSADGLGAESRLGAGVLGWSTVGGATTAELGQVVLGAGDVNGDGWPDLLATAQGTREIRVYLGSAAGPSTRASWQVHGDPEAVASAGDVNGDGYDDVLVGARTEDLGLVGEGLARLYLGSPTGLATVASWTGRGGVADANFGYGVALADVNGDGLADVVVGALAGTVSVFFGSTAGPASTPDVILTGTGTVRYGRRVASAGDVDADGFDDLLLGDAQSGAVSLHRGGPTGPEPAPSWTSAEEVITAFAAAGDVDGDGYGDVILGADGFANGKGHALVYLGGAGGLGAGAAWTRTGASVGDRVGRVVTGVGDLDGDGYDDVGITRNSSTDPRVELDLGGPSGLSARPLLRFGTSSTIGNGLGPAGDVDLDGYADVLVGDPYYDGAQANEGIVYLLRGGALPDTDGDGASDPVDACPSVPDPEQLDSDGDGVGNACDAPTLALDGVPSSGATVDLVASAAPGEQVSFYGVSGAGGVGPCPASLGGTCLSLGPAAASLGVATAGANGIAVLPVTVPAGIVPGGPYALQASIARGVGGADSVVSDVLVLDGEDLDWDGDGLVDADEARSGTDPRDPDTDADGVGDAEEVADPQLDPLDPDTDGDGVSDGLDACPVGDDAVDADLDGVADRCDDCPAVANPGQVDTDADGLGNACERDPLVLTWSVTGAQLEMLGQTTASAGDVNGDGIDDLLVGAMDTSATQVGRVDLYLGDPAGPIGPVWSVSGAASGDRASYGTSAGDVNGDGYDDVVVGAPEEGAADRGSVKVYYGSAAGPSAVADWTLVGDQAGALLGLAESAGDVNGDGYGDLVVLAPGESHGETREGEAQVYLGSALGLGAAPDWTVESNQVGAGPVDLDADRDDVTAAADVNGDGYTDLVLGSPFADGERGAVALFEGGPTGLSSTPSWIRRGDHAYEQVGAAVASAGDVDGDGYDDVLIGAPGAYQAWLFRGSRLGLETTSSWSTTFTRNYYLDPVAGGDLASGDVNGDGFADVVVGEVGWSLGGEGSQLAQGQARVYLGSAAGLSPSPAWSAIGQVALGYDGGDPVLYGWDVDLGDFDGDGLSDVLCAAPHAYVSALDRYHGRVQLWTAVP